MTGLRRQSRRKRVAWYIWLRGDVPIALRVGAFTDPDHEFFTDLDSDQLHYTIGAAVVLQDRVQIDGAVNLADNIKEGLLSLVFRF